MNEILRDFTLNYNLENSKVTNENGYICFYNSDENISTLFIKLQATNSEGLLSFLRVSEATSSSSPVCKLQIQKAYFLYCI